MLQAIRHHIIFVHFAKWNGKQFYKQIPFIYIYVLTESNHPVWHTVVLGGDHAETAMGPTKVGLGHTGIHWNRGDVCNSHQQQVITTHSCEYPLVHTLHDSPPSIKHVLILKFIHFKWHTTEELCPNKIYSTMCQKRAYMLQLIE